MWDISSLRPDSRQERILLTQECIKRFHLDIVSPISLVIIAEMLIFLGQMKAAIAVHALNIILLVSLAMIRSDRIYPVVMMLSLFRILNVTMPVFFNLTLYSYATIYMPMLLPVFMIMREGIFDRQETGLTLRGFLTYLPLAIGSGFALGWGEYQVIRPEVLLPEVNPKNVLILAAVMILLVGFIEEFIFRSMLQNVMIERAGSIPGLLITSVIFGFMHSGYHIPQELVYVSFAGAVFGVIFWSTRSLPVISVAHGVTNISLFLVVPAYPQYLPYFIGVPFMIHLIATNDIRKLIKKIQIGDGVS
ncbi:MAG: CPBP family intramembrane metalloprotease [Methanothrix sp.]|jgi:membrane protease YdiL (CAAX protease family)|uniref:CPBP family intramembrane glutamic endopeptidase n=1 Tax=Methanothrix sp. TaxID=90426 RepID=UPI00247D3752|nr:CPBP family intramembrane metalloprotease [Methanothrix sp.]